jgi:hypothetical protein
MATTRGAGLSGSVDSVRRAVFRLPLGSQVAIAIAFVCSYLAYGRIAGHAAPAGWILATGIASFLVLFVQLRLVDDLDDLERDHPVGRWGASRRSALQARLVMGLVACMAAIALLNAARLDGLIAAAVATALTLAGPFGFKRLFPTRLAFGSIVFEGAPLSIFAYIYFFWRDAGGVRLSLVALACVGGLFWTGYEFWKFSRKVHTDAMQPYFLSSREIRLALNVFLSLALAANVGLARVAGLSAVYAAYAALLPLAFLIWVNATWPSTPEAKARARAARPLWAGLTFVGAVELGLLLELTHALGTR